MFHGYAIYYRQSQNGIEIELLGQFYKNIQTAMAEVLDLNAKSPNLNAFVRESYFTFRPI